MALLQASGPAEGVVGVAGGAAGTGLGAEGGAERFPAGTDATGGGTQHPEGNQPEPGLEQCSPHQPVPGINQMHTYTHRNASTHLQLHTQRCFVFQLPVNHLHAKKGFSASQWRHSGILPSRNKKVFKALAGNETIFIRT